MPVAGASTTAAGPRRSHGPFPRWAGFALLVAAALAVLPALVARAHGDVTFPPVDYTAVSVQGGYAYAGDSSRRGVLRVVHVADPAAPTQAAQAGLAGQSVTDVPSAGAYVYATSANSRLVGCGGPAVQAVDARDPARPVVPSQTSGPGFLCWDFRVQGLRTAVAGDRLYAAIWGYGGGGFPVSSLSVYGREDPARPVFADGVVLAQGGCAPSRPAVVGTTVFVATCLGGQGFHAPGPLGLIAVDVADTARPAVLGSVSFGGSGSVQYDPAPAVAAAGGYAYVGGPDATEPLRTVDVGDPSRPAVVATTPPRGVWSSAVVAGARLYAATSTGLEVYGLDDPARPAFLGAYAAPAGNDVALAGTTAYLAAGPGGLRVVDVADPANPRELGAFTLPPHVHTFLPLVPQQAAPG
jgi:hypothetical protein